MDCQRLRVGLRRSANIALVCLLALICFSSVGHFILNINPAFVPEVVHAQQSGSFYTVSPNVKYAPMVFTATSQNKTQIINGVDSCTVSISGAATAATLTMTAAQDGGTNYFGIPYSDGSITATYNLVKGIAAGAWTYSGTALLYYVDLAGFSNVKVTSSSTFTGTPANVQITCSANHGIF